MLKKAIKGKEQDVMNELSVLRGLEHENIVRSSLSLRPPCSLRRIAY
jgi:hypothetical protein